MLLLLVIDYGLTLFYLANPISNDIHCVHSIKQQDILPMSNPCTLHCAQSDTALIRYSHPAGHSVVMTPLLPFTLTRCCL
ncbi:hypothetical protein yfred0001_6540 [Yersinia frederiksenii ATCC 33641]|nr:hypothetical protein yfred0001_6540 [Yersinia frederiksenii ATCC 33641]